MIRNIIIAVVLGMVVGLGLYKINHLDTGILICTYNGSQNGVELSNKYEVTFSNKVVDNIKSIESLKSSNSDVLNNYKESLDKMYSKYKNLKYYDNKIELKNNKLVVETEINYKKIDMKKLEKIDKNIKEITSNGKIKVKDIKKQYQNREARCIYKFSS